MHRGEEGQRRDSRQTMRGRVRGREAVDKYTDKVKTDLSVYRDREEEMVDKHKAQEEEG
jgi:hypothetical protein